MLKERKILVISFTIFIFVLTMFLGTFNVSASSYSPTSDLFENNYSNNLIDMAINQVPNFLHQDFVIFVQDNTYYLVTGTYDRDSLNTIHFTDSTIIRAFRSNNYNYSYDSFTESNTYINRSYILTGNVTGKNIVSSSRFNNYYNNLSFKNLGIFILGLVFAIFLTKERRY